MNWLKMLDGSQEDVTSWKLDDPVDGKFDYPEPRRRDQKNVEARIKAEQQFDRF